MRAPVSLPQSTQQALIRSLEALRTVVDAHLVLLFNATGQQLLKCGDDVQLGLDIVIPLVANGIAAVNEAAHLMQDGDGFTLYYHVGSSFDLYGASISDELMILLRLDHSDGQARLGTVWYYLQQTIKEIRRYFKNASQEEAGASEESVPAKTVEPGRAVRTPVTETRPAPHVEEDQIPPARQVEGAEKKDSGLLSYEEAITEGLIRNER